MSSEPARPGITASRLACAFLFVTLGFVVYRASTFAIWNDSASVLAMDGFDPSLYDQIVAGRRVDFETRPLEIIQIFTWEAFHALSNGYRPIPKLWDAVTSYYFYDHHATGARHLVLVGTLYGAFTVVFLCVARRFVHRELTAWFALVLMLASPPMAATSWIYLSCPQVVVPLVMGAALLAYWSWVERRRFLALAALVALLVIAPWIREILFVLPLLIGFLEVQRTRGKLSWLLGFTALALAHSIYPTAVVKWLLFPDLPLSTVFALGGSVSQALAGSGLRWQAALHFLPLLPPLLWLLGATGAFIPLAALDADSHPTAPLSRWRIALAGLRAVSAAMVVAFTVLLWYLQIDCWAAVLCLLLPALAWRRRHPFLALWFLLLALPLLRVFTEHIHFLYSMVPATIVFAGEVEGIWLWLGERRGVLRAIRYPLAAVAVLISADQSLHLYGAYRTNHVTYGGIQTMGAWFRKNVKAGDLVVSNVIHGEDIWINSGLHFRHFWSIPWGVSDPARIVADPGRFRQILVQPDRPDLYLLSVEFDYRPEKLAHRHKYVFQYDVVREDRGLIYRTRLRYPFLDPLRHLICREYVPFLGAPDLLNDFYHGPPRDHSWFRYEVYADYHLYRVTGRELSPSLEGPVTLVEENVAGFNLLKIGEAYLAFPQSVGHFDVDRYRAGNYGPPLWGWDLDEVRSRALAKGSNNH